jgi:hypothetical protein
VPQIIGSVSHPVRDAESVGLEPRMAKRVVQVTAGTITPEQAREIAAAAVAADVIPRFVTILLARLLRIVPPEETITPKKVAVGKTYGWLYQLQVPGFWLLIVPYNGKNGRLVRLGYGNKAYTDIHYSSRPGEPLIYRDDCLILAGFAAVAIVGTTPTQLEADLKFLLQAEPGTGTTVMTATTDPL